MFSNKKIHNMNLSELENFSDEIANFIALDSQYDLETVFKNLSILELTLAIHHVFDMARTKILFDDPSQQIVHCLLNKKEELYSQTSALSEALVYDKYYDYVFVILNEASFNYGSNYEALLQLNKVKNNVKIILLDEQSSLLKHYSNLDTLIRDVRISNSYLGMKKDLKEILDHPVSKPVLGGITWIRDQIKQTLIEPSLFEHFSIDYHLPVDGHNFKDLIKVLKHFSKKDMTQALHVHTRLRNKGKRRLPFPRYKTDRSRPSNYKNSLEYLDYFLIKKNNTSKLQIFTDGNHISEQLIHFSQKYPDQYHPFNGSLFSMIDTSVVYMRMNYPVILLISSLNFSVISDRLLRQLEITHSQVLIILYEAGLNRYDQIQTNAVFDHHALLMFQNYDVKMPRSNSQFINLLDAYFNKELSNICIIRKNHDLSPMEEENNDAKSTWKEILEITTDSEAVVISYGSSVCDLKNKIEVNNLDIGLIDAESFLEIDEDILEKIGVLNLDIIVYNIEDSMDLLSRNIKVALFENGYENNIKSLNLKDVNYNLSSKDLKTEAEIHIEDVIDEVRR